MFESALLDLTEPGGGKAVANSVETPVSAVVEIDCGIPIGSVVSGETLDAVKLALACND